MVPGLCTKRDFIIRENLDSPEGRLEVPPGTKIYLFWFNRNFSPIVAPIVALLVGLVEAHKCQSIHHKYPFLIGNQIDIPCQSEYSHKVNNFFLSDVLSSVVLSVAH